MNKAVSIVCLRMYNKNYKIKIKLFKARLTLVSVLIFFHAAGTKTLGKKQLKIGRADLRSQFEDTVHYYGKAVCWEECEVAGHIVSWPESRG